MGGGGWKGGTGGVVVMTGITTTAATATITATATATANVTTTTTTTTTASGGGGGEYSGHMGSRRMSQVGRLHAGTPWDGEFDQRRGLVNCLGLDGRSRSGGGGGGFVVGLLLLLLLLLL